MMRVGLWGGGSWNCVIWGGYHGALLSLERVVRGDRASAQERSWSYPAKALGTFALVLIGWVFFRAKDLPESLYIIHQMFGAAHGKILLERWHVGLAVVALLVALAEEKWEGAERLIAAPGWAYGTAVLAMLFCSEIFGVGDGS